MPWDFLHLGTKRDAKLKLDLALLGLQNISGGFLELSKIIM
jgi:hypothetical protein